MRTGEWAAIRKADKMRTGTIIPILTYYLVFYSGGLLYPTGGVEKVCVEINIAPLTLAPTVSKAALRLSLGPAAQICAAYCAYVRDGTYSVTIAGYKTGVTPFACSPRSCYRTAVCSAIVIRSMVKLANVCMSYRVCCSSYGCRICRESGK